VRVGLYSTYPIAVASDPMGNPTWAQLFAVSSLKSFSLDAVNSVPQFVGCVVAGQGISTNIASTISILGGWFHSEVGRMNSVLSLTPQDATIENSNGLVHGLVVEQAALDAFVAGKVRLRSGSTTTSAASAYIVRFNPLFQNAVYGVRFTPVVAGETSTAKALVLADSYVYLVCEIFSAQQNRTDLSLLKLNAATGLVVKQVRVIGPGSISCSKISLSNELLTIACGLKQQSQLLKPLLFMVNKELTFTNLLSSYQRYYTASMQSVSFPIVASSLPVTQSSVTPSTTPGSFSSPRIQAGVGGSPLPSRRPTVAPSCKPTAAPTLVKPSALPSSQPSASPSTQPTAAPTSSPSISPAPTCLPSSASPTITHRPTKLPTSQPTSRPTAQPVATPSGQPSAQPSGRPSTQPTGMPSAQPSRQPLARPTAQPTASPTSQPSSSPTGVPVAEPTSVPSVAATQPNGQSSENNNNKNNSSDSYVVPVVCSVVGAFAVFGFLYYRSTKAAKKEDGQKSSSVSPASASTSTSATTAVTATDCEMGGNTTGSHLMAAKAAVSKQPKAAPVVVTASRVAAAAPVARKKVAPAGSPGSAPVSVPAAVARGKAAVKTSAPTPVPVPVPKQGAAPKKKLKLMSASASVLASASSRRKIPSQRKVDELRPPAAPLVQSTSISDCSLSSESIEELSDDGESGSEYGSQFGSEYDSEGDSDYGSESGSNADFHRAEASEDDEGCSDFSEKGLFDHYIDEEYYDEDDDQDEEDEDDDDIGSEDDDVAVQTVYSNIS
jgi:hypothetical protein